MKQFCLPQSPAVVRPNRSIALCPRGRGASLASHISGLGQGRGYLPDSPVPVFTHGDGGFVRNLGECQQMSGMATTAFGTSIAEPTRALPSETICWHSPGLRRVRQTVTGEGPEKYCQTVRGEWPSHPTPHVKLSEGWGGLT